MVVDTGEVENPEAAMINWDIGFFMKRLPPPFRIQSDRLRMVNLAESGKRGFEQLCGSYPALAEFKRTAGKDGVFLAALRILAKDEGEAVDQSWAIVGYALDGLSLACDFVPAIAPVLVLRKEKSSDAELREFSFHTWSTHHTTGSDADEVWRKRCDKVLDRILPFFNFALDDSWRSQTPLQNQIVYSARLFRIGCEIQSFGVEYLCKFASVEGMVIGSNRQREKAKKLGDRIPRLLRGAQWDVLSVVKELWEKRHLIAHEARGEFFSGDQKSFPHQLLTPRLDQIGLAVLVFAIDNMANAQSVSDLWKLVDQYKLPEFVLEERPKQMFRLPMTHTLVNRHEIWKDAGQWFDNVLDPDMATFSQTIKPAMPTTQS